MAVPKKKAPKSKRSSNHAAIQEVADSERCPNCKEQANSQSRNCLTCQFDLGAPNVRAAKRPQEKRVLSTKYQRVHNHCNKAGTTNELALLERIINEESKVVVAMPPLAARSFLTSTSGLHATYEQQVNAGIRAPANAKDDSARNAVGSVLFGSYNSDIHYGLLSLDGRSLKSYGTVFLSLKTVAVKDRVSFLTENSFLLVVSLKTAIRGEIEPGHRACWEDRATLTAIKLGERLQPGHNKHDFAAFLVKDGATREEDSCVEAHIFSTFTPASIDNINIADATHSDEELRDIAAVKECWNKRIAATP